MELTLFQWLDLAAKMAAVLIGGAWVLFNYVRDHRPRLQLRVSAERVPRDGLEYVTIKTELSNVGLSRVRIHKGCAIELYAHRLPKRVNIVMEPRWDKLPSFDLFDDQHWVEPNGLLVDEQLVALPGLADRCLKVHARVQCTRSPQPWASSKIGWVSKVVVAHPAPTELRTGNEAAAGVSTEQPAPGRSNRP